MIPVFACIVQPKVIEFGSDRAAHRALKVEELKAELLALALPASEQEQPGDAATGPLPEPVFQPGGGCRVLSADSSTSVASVGTAICVFQGSLTNAVQLVESYAPLPEDEPAHTDAKLSGAELMCHMYAKVGVELLGLLRGSFSFVLYESKTSRVLAARDGSGRCPVFQARTAADSLIVASSAALLEAGGCHDVLEFQPGDYKYGWSAIPRRYQPAENARLSRRSLDLSSSHLPPSYAHAHSPHHVPLSGGSRRNSIALDAAPGGHSGSNTPAGSRPGSRRTSLDVHHNTHGEQHHGTPGNKEGNRSRRTSMDHHNSNVGPNGAGKEAHNGGGNGHNHHHGGASYRTYVVKAEDPRVTRESNNGNKDRRRSMDAHGSWRLGSDQGAQQQQQQGSDAAPQQQQPGGGNRRRSGTGRPSRDGRPSIDSLNAKTAAAAPVTPQRTSSGGVGAAAGSPTAARPAAAAAAAAGASLRVDAPEWTPAWVASSVPVATGK